MENIELKGSIPLEICDDPICFEYLALLADSFRYPARACSSFLMRSYLAILSSEVSGFPFTASAALDTPFFRLSKNPIINHLNFFFTRLVAIGRLVPHAKAEAVVEFLDGAAVTRYVKP